MGLRSAKLEQRPYSVAATGVRTWGIMHRGLDAAIVGGIATAVARFAVPPTASTRRLASNQNAATNAQSDPVQVTTTANDGTTFTIIRPGIWQVDFVTAALGAAGAVSVQAGLNVDGIAADFVAGTTQIVPDGDRFPAMPPGVTLLAGAAQRIPIVMGTQISVAEGQRPVVRGIITTGVPGVVVAGTVSLAGTYINFTWLRDRAS